LAFQARLVSFSPRVVKLLCRMSRIDNLEPGQWFKDKLSGWQKDLHQWHMKHMAWKSQIRGASGSDLGLKSMKGAGKGVAPAPPPPQAPPAEEKKDEEMKAAEEEKKEEAAPKTAQQLLEEELAKGDFDIFSVDDVADMGSGEPLFAKFSFEDWAMVSLRFEMHLLVHAFLKDCGEPDRKGFSPEHLLFYYQRYFKKALNPKTFGLERVEELIDLAEDTLCVCDDLIESQLETEQEHNGIFVMLGEEARRERQEKIDAGDESAKLRFSSVPPPETITPVPPPPGGCGGGFVVGGCMNRSPPPPPPPGGGFQVPPPMGGSWGSPPPPGGCGGGWGGGGKGWDNSGKGGYGPMKGGYDMQGGYKGDFKGGGGGGFKGDFKGGGKWGGGDFGGGKWGGDGGKGWSGGGGGGGWPSGGGRW